MKRIFLVFSLLMIFCLSLPAQAPPPPPPSPTGGGTNGPVGGESSLGSGIIILLAAAFAYYKRKIHGLQENLEDIES